MMILGDLNKLAKGSQINVCFCYKGIYYFLILDLKLYNLILNVLKESEQFSKKFLFYIYIYSTGICIYTCIHTYIYIHIIYICSLAKFLQSLDIKHFLLYYSNN